MLEIDNRVIEGKCLAVGYPLRASHTVASCRQCLCTGSRNRFGTARIPDIDQYEWIARDVKITKSLDFFVHFASFSNKRAFISNP